MSSSDSVVDLTGAATVLLDGVNGSACEFKLTSDEAAVFTDADGRLIDGAASFVMSGRYSAARLVLVGTQWLVF